MSKRNTEQAGNPRYQPKRTKRYLGYDRIAYYYVRVQLALLDVFAARGEMPPEDYALLTPAVRRNLLRITTTLVDALEKAVTRHDIRALVRLMQERVPKPLRRWIHLSLTSYDVINTARALQFRETYLKAIHPMLLEVEQHFVTLVRKNAGVAQIGRTHGQHAVPITAGFWLATILARIIKCHLALHAAAHDLRGKISGPTGSYNGQEFLDLIPDYDAESGFEKEVLARLELEPDLISTQITLPESMQTFLFRCVQMTAALAQFGLDCRQLMRSEIREIVPDVGGIGSSAMPHKINPVDHEGVQGVLIRSIGEFHKVLAVANSEHQRDLVGSGVERDFQIILTNLAVQLEKLLRRNKAGVPFLERVHIDAQQCRANVIAAGPAIMAEPLYLALQRAGYEGDAHALVHDEVIPQIKRHVGSVEQIAELLAKKHGHAVESLLIDRKVRRMLMTLSTHTVPNVTYWEGDLIEVLQRIGRKNRAVREALKRIPKHRIAVLGNPFQYTGIAKAKAISIADMAEKFIVQLKAA